MLVIIEGADGSGKTTLANRIRGQLGQYAMFLRTSGPPSIVEIANVCHWVDSHPHTLPLIMDRYPLLSEYVYGPILRGKCKHAMTIEMMARALRNAMVIHCRPNYSALAANVQKEVQLEGVLVNHRHIVKKYDELMGNLEKGGVHVKRYDYTGPPQLIFDSIKGYLAVGAP